jgi:dephospho-CoA kinase
MGYRKKDPKGREKNCPITPTPMIVIGLTGPMASGKATLVGVLKKQGFQSVTMSDVIREEMERQGIPAERTRMQDFANAVRAKEGGGAWARRCLEMAKRKGWKNWVIDGIRNPVEIEELRRDPGFVLVAVMLGEAEIVRRILARKRDIDPTDPEEIKRRLRRDWGVNEPPEGQQVNLCVRVADYFFDNSIPIEQVETEFLKLYERIQNK